MHWEGADATGALITKEVRKKRADGQVQVGREVCRPNQTSRGATSASTSELIRVVTNVAGQE